MATTEHTHEEDSLCHEDTTENPSQASPDCNKSDMCRSADLSNHLLYADKYSECYQERKLRITHNKKDGREPRPQTFQMHQSSVLSKLRDFLPQMCESNKLLAATIGDDHETASKVNIEHIENTNASFIEMNLSFVPPEMLGNEDTSDNDSSSESESDEETKGCRVTSDKVDFMEENIRIVPKSVKKPCIEEIGPDKCIVDSFPTCR